MTPSEEDDFVKWLISCASEFTPKTRTDQRDRIKQILVARNVKNNKLKLLMI